MSLRDSQSFRQMLFKGFPQTIKLANNRLIAGASIFLITHIKDQSANKSGQSPAFASYRPLCTNLQKPKIKTGLF